MCGIAGFIGEGTKDDALKMKHSLHHRGPDHSGTYQHNNTHLCHTRLAIIDTNETGKQPMTSHDNTIVITFNGEIYNYQEIKEDLLKKGYSFKTKTDTEVLLHAFSQYNTEVFSKCNGMFAVALYDTKTNTITLARDRMGQKPLYYTIVNKTLIFGSELKAIFAHPLVKKEISHIAVEAFLLHEYIPQPHTIYKNIFKLPPGTFATFKNNELTITPYWKLDCSNINQNITENEAIEELDTLLSESTRIRLMSDVPLGIFLSGGIDSSAIAYYAQKNSTQKIKTFSISFSEKTFDESSYSQQIASFLNTEHNIFPCTHKDALDLIPQLHAITDEPFADPSIIPTLLLSQHTKKQVTVALGGDGSDELFAGYPTFIAEKYYQLYTKIPQQIRNHLIKPIIQSLPENDSYFSTTFKAKKFIQPDTSEKSIRHHVWVGAFNHKERSKILNIPLSYTPLHKPNTQQDILIEYQQTYLPDDILTKVDRASMHHALEVRAPFLDHRIVSFANNIPYHLKLHNNTTKYILKQCMKNKIPNNIIHRKKQGFAIPIAKWLNNELNEWMNEMLQPKNLSKINIINSEYAQTLIQEHQSKKHNHRKKLWTLLMLASWFNNTQ